MKIDREGCVMPFTNITSMNIYGFSTFDILYLFFQNFVAIIKALIDTKYDYHLHIFFKLKESKYHNDMMKSYGD